MSRSAAALALSAMTIFAGGCGTSSRTGIRIPTTALESAGGHRDPLAKPRANFALGAGDSLGHQLHTQAPVPLAMRSQPSRPVVRTAMSDWSGDEFQGIRSQR